MKQFSDVPCKYGAPMGRRSYCDNPEAKVNLFKVRMVDGDYDDGGAYWGGSSGIRPLKGETSAGVAYLYCARDDDGQVQMFVRAWDRDEAKALILEDEPELTFYR